MTLPEANTPGSPQAPSGMSNELTLPSINNQQASTPPPPPKSDSTRVIPVIPPNQEVLVLPQASRDFLGHWGGGLSLVSKFGPSDAPEHLPISFKFGERGGQVALATTVFANPNVQILKTRADSAGPSEVKFEVVAMNLGSESPVRHVEKVTITLDGANRVRVIRRIDFYVSGQPDPVAGAVYQGSLSVITGRESDMFSQQALRDGMTPMERINEGGFPQQPPE